MSAIFELPPFLTTPVDVGPISLPFTLLELMLAFLLPMVGITVGLYLLSLAVRRIVRRAPVTDETRTRILRWVRRSARVVWLGSLLILAGRLLGAEMVRWIGATLRILSQPFYTSGSTEISVVTLVMVIPVFYLAGWLSRAARHTLERGVLRRLNLDPARQFSLLSAVRVVVMGLTIVIGLSIIGINLSSLAVLFGVLGIGVGFGLQESVANMFSGVVIMFSRPIKEGDRVLVEEIEGTVQHIKLLHTVVNTITNETIIIPNSKITGNAMHNYSYDDVSIIVCNPVQVSYASDLDRVGEVLMSVARRNPYARSDRQARYHVWSFDDSGITVRLCTWINDARDRIIAFSWTNLEMWRAFRDNGIEIPFPQLDLHVKNGGKRQPQEGPAGQQRAPLEGPGDVSAAPPSDAP